MAAMSDFYYFLIAGGVLMLVPIFVIAYFQAGFFGKWLKARTGRGKYVLIKLRSKLRDYFTYGEIKGEYLIYGKKDNTRRLLIPEGAIYRAWGVACVDLDEATNSVCSVNYKPVEGFDAEKFEGLYIRALYRPSLEENRDKVILVLIIIAIAVGAIGLFMNWNLSNQIAAISNTGVINTVL